MRLKHQVYKNPEFIILCEKCTKFRNYSRKIGKPVKIPAIIPETKEEQERFEGALRRKQLSLVLAGKMKPHDATELKALFLAELQLQCRTSTDGEHFFSLPASTWHARHSGS